MNSVEVKEIKKTYQAGKEMITALNGISFDVNEGELFGLIGPDGAGKTSLFRILTTVLLPDGGSATVNGFDVVKDYKKIRHCVGYMPGKFSLYQDLTVEENLNFFATLFNTTIKENYDLIKDIYVQIEPFKTRRAGKLSGGMKQKLALSCALIHKPAVLFLDEPTTGVDPVSRKEFWEMLKRLKQQGITIVVSTPYMDEATLCDRIALIQHGNILSIDTPDKITNSFPHQLYAIKSNTIYQLLKDINTYENSLNCYAFGEYLHLVFKDENQNREEELLKYLRIRNHTDIELKPIDATIEDCFIGLLK
jgi:ABC-type multidrug transport system ATPase subunit